MLREFGGQTVYIGCPSAGRPQSVATLHALVGPVTWFVPRAQVCDYFAAGAGRCVGDGGKGVAGARNMILTMAERNGAEICVQVDDDLVKMNRAIEKKPVEANPTDAIEDIVQRLAFSDFHLAGVAPTNNAYFTQRATSTNLFVNGSLIAVKSTHLRFDTAIKLKEDYAYTLDHILEYGGVLRCDEWLPTFRHYTNSGGAVAYRSHELEEETINYLLARYPGMVKRHPRREREVLLSVPRRKRVTL